MDVQNSPSVSIKKVLGGTVRIFLAEMLILPTGMITAAFLTRQLGPEGYGLFTLTATLISWLGWSLTSIFTRTTIKFVGEADDWQPVGTTVLRIHLILGVAVMLLVWILATPIARILDEPELINYVRLFAVDIPLFCLAYAHRSILVGIGYFTQRALAIAGRWISRLILIILLVHLGFSVSGAILGSIGASIFELVVSRFYIRPSLFKPSNFPVKQLWSYAIPLFLFALFMRLYEKLDLFALKILGGTAADVGYYGAAQNLALIPGLFTLAFTPLLLSTISRLMHQGNDEQAKKLSFHAMRAILLMLPFAALTAGTASELVTFIFGSVFLPTAPLLACLIFGSIGLAMISVTTAILTAAGKPNWTLVVAAPLLPLAVAGYWLVIPHLGALGASLVSSSFAILGGLAAVASIYKLWKISPPAKTLGRSLIVCILIYVLAVIWSTSGVFIFIKLSLLGLLVLACLWALGEFSPSEIDGISSWVLTRFKES